MGAFQKVAVVVLAIAILGPVLWRYRDQREYNFRTTADEAANNVDLSGKVIIVTGANTGIGKPTARVLLDRGATVIMACRNMDKAKKARTDILNALSTTSHHSFSDLSERLTALQLDLSSLASVDEFSKDFQSSYDRLDYLVLNAGLQLTEYTTTKDGIEQVFGVNHVGHFRLAMNLTPLLIQTASPQSIARLISVASWAHNAAPKPLSDWFANDTLIQSEDAFSMFPAYALSKAANILFAREYNDRYRDQNVYAVSLHPGSVASDFTRNHHFLVQFLYDGIGGATVLKGVEQGAATTVRTVSISDEEFKQNGGAYFSDCNEANGDLRADLFPIDVDENSKESPKKLLWTLTENMIRKFYSDAQ